MRPLLVGLSLVLAAATVAQPRHPDAGPFDPTVLPTVRIALHPDTLAWILAPENRFSDREWRATFVWDDGTAAETVEEIGFRLRGNTSRHAPKKSFKVSFNRFRPGREWNGLDKLNLNGEHNDPSMIRAILAWGVVADSRIPASRANPVRLEINGDFFGVYANVEHIDEEFLASRFRAASGTLYKARYPADLADLGEDPATYRDNPRYELKQGDGDFADFARFVTTLNQTREADFPDTVEEIFDVNGYLRVVALDMLLGNWDGYAYYANNYYLYNDPELGVFRYLPYDLDNSLGIDFRGPDWGTRDVYAWPRGGLSRTPPRPLAKRLLAVPDYRDRLSFYLRRLMDRTFRRDIIEPRALALRDLIAADIAEDPYYPLEFGYTADDFAASFTEPLGGHVDYGLLPFIDTRRTSAFEQVEVVDIAPLLSERRTDPNRPRPGEAVTVRVWVEDEATPASVILTYRVDGGAWTSAPMAEESDEVYETAIGPFDAGAQVSYYVEATDASGQSRADPRGGAEATARFTVASSGSGGLFVNEVLASNDASFADEAGEFDDWIEIYNGSDAPVSLDGLFITDDFSEPDKYALPDSTIAPGTYAIIWADDDPDQGPLHTPFKLSADGEGAALFASDGAGGFILVDGFSFGEQTTDVSFGRLPDGGAALATFATPTPGSANGGETPSEASPEASTFHVSALYPNPTRGSMTLRLHLPRASTVAGEVVDALGRVVARIDARRLSAGEVTLSWTGDLAPGIYVVRVHSLGMEGERAVATRRLTVVR